MDILETIKKQIADNKMIIYMKGSPSAPHCGFSAQAVRLLDACGHPYAYVDILVNPDIRATLPTYANWPTFPQLYINGELIGGCDIMTELFEKGELQKMVNEAFAS
jgi:monothiol glutaredoxin